MNAANPLHAPSPPRHLDRASPLSADRQVEPSMEEILASIRRIIADDQALPQHEPHPAPPQRGAAQERPAAQSSRRVEEEEEAPRLAAYGQVMAPQYPSLEGPATLDAEAAADEQHTDGAAEHDSAAAPQADSGTPSHPNQQDMPMRETIARESGPDGGRDHRDFMDRAPDRPAEPRPSALFSQATDSSLSSAFNMLAATRIVDDADELRAMAREMIRPLLKDWLDDNLPSLVERLVRAEIERVARGGR